MSTIPSLPAHPAAKARRVRTLRRYRYRKPLKHCLPLRDSISGDTWLCWPHPEIREKPAQTMEPVATVSEKRMTGFSLYAVPPTPPPRKYHLQGRPMLRRSGTLSTFGRSQPETDIDWLTDGPILSMHAGFGSERVPTSLKFWKPRTGTSSSYSSQDSPCRDRGSKAVKRISAVDSRRLNMDNHKRLSRDRVSSVPIRRNGSRMARLRSRAGQKGHRHQRSNSASDSVSRWFDTDEGLIDRKRLSTYLGNVLGSSFHVPNLDHLPSQATESITLETVYPVLSRPGPLNLNPPGSFQLPSPSASLPCKCTEGTVLCQSKSSSEFKIFSRWPVFRKSQISIGSSACRIHVTQAHQENSLPRPRTPQLREIALSYSPTPSLYRTTKSSDGRGGSELMSSYHEEDVLATPPSLTLSPTALLKAAGAQLRRKRYSYAPATKPQPPPSAYKPLWSNLSARQPVEPDSPGHSSFSSFDFDFDFDSKRHFQRVLSVPRPRISDQVIQRHLRHSQVTQTTGKPLSSANVAAAGCELPSRRLLATHQNINAPTSRPRVHETIIKKKDGRVEFYTRIQILRPTPECEVLELHREQTHVHHASQQKTVDVDWYRHAARTQMNERPSSRVTSDGSPVLGQVGMVQSH